MAKFDIKTVKPKFVVTTAPETKIDVSINRPIITAKNQKAYFKLKNTGGPKGEKGDTGTAATITVGSTSTGAPGTSASVTNTGSASAAVLDFVIPKGDKGDTGDTGATGSPGAAATVTVGTTATSNPGTNASVTNAGTSSAAVLNFTIPRGAKGDAGDSSTITVGTTTTGQPGTNASVTNSGTQSAAVLNFTIPRGDKGDQGDPGTPGSPGAAATIAVGTTTTGNPGTNASVTNSGTSSAAVFNFAIPKGAKGDPGDPGTPGTAATIAVGTTQTGNPGTNASVVNSGTSSAAVLDFTIPRGAKGDPGNPGSAATIAVGTVTTGLPGTSATVTNVGTSSAAVFDFTIPRGDKGEAGSGSGDMLAADYDPNGTVANAGGIVDYVTAHEPTKTSDLVNDGSDGTAAYLETDETAYKTASIPYGACDPSSTTTAYTATVPGVTELRDGVCMWLKNGVATSAAGFTLDINGLGAKPVYNNMAAAGRETTIWNANYTMFFVYDSTRVEGGCWMLYRGYNSDNNTIGYQLRTNSYSLPMTSIVYRYRLLFTSADGEHFVPSNNSTSTNATASRTVCQDPIDPFGNIVYYSASASVAAGSRPSATSLWSQYAISLGYSFNRTGAALVLTLWKPVYIKCAPQPDGSAIIDSTTPYVQDLPSTEDGKIYIFLGVAYTTANIELTQNHPVYYYKDGQIRLWTNAAATGGGSMPLYTELGENTDGPITQKASREALYVDSGKTVVKLGTKAFSTDTYGVRSTSVGAGTRAGGDNSVAVGDSSSSMGAYTIAIGSNATTGTGSSSISIGYGAKTNDGTARSNSVALGAHASATRDYEVNVGTGSSAGFGGNDDHTRVIAGVHAGVQDTDAVNVGQLNAALPTKTSDLTNDGADGTSTYVEADDLATVATSGSYNDLTDKPSVMSGLVEMSYGEANAWAKFIAAYQAGQIVYCRASSNADPSSGSQTRKAFMAYVNNATSPTQVEFQYYRSVSSHTDAQQGDQVFVYLLTSANGGTWSVTTRNAFSKVVAGTNMTSSYNNGTITLNATQPTVPTKTSDLANDGADGTSTYVEADELATVATTGDYSDLSGTPTIPTVNDATLTIKQNTTTLGTFTANASTGTTVTISTPTRTTIYSKSSGTNANFSTTSAMSNYDDVEITFRDTNSNYATRTVPGNAGSFVLDIVHPGGSSVAYWYISRFIVSGTGITVGANNMRKALQASSLATTATQDIYITKMVGIKY